MIYRNAEIEVRHRRKKWESYVRLPSTTGQIFIGAFQSQVIAEMAAKEWVEKKGEDELMIRNFFSMTLRAIR